MLLQLSKGPGQHNWESQNSPGLLAAPSCLPRKEAMPLLACLIAMVVYHVHPDVEFGLVLVSHWICCHSYSSNRTTDLCLLLYCCLEIKSLSLQLMVGCLLPYPKLKTWQGHLKAQHTLLCVDLCLLFLRSQTRGYRQAA